MKVLRAVVVLQAMQNLEVINSAFMLFISLPKVLNHVQIVKRAKCIMLCLVGTCSFKPLPSFSLSSKSF